ncbi:MAG: hypothetical protein IT384_05865 [Deltaproteobacteria bacterium]|nr:hypothetical protein [Deltaproteobacteria bacterium]
MILDALQKLLDEEQAAIACLDGERLDRIAQRKIGLVGRLRSTLTETPSAELAAQLRATLIRADVNRMLLGEAQRILSAALGLVDDEGTYDSRARVFRHRPSLAFTDV